MGHGVDEKLENDKEGGNTARGGGDSPPTSGGTPTGRGGNGPTISGAALGGLGRLLPRALQPKPDDSKPARPTSATPNLPPPSKAKATATPTTRPDDLLAKLDGTATGQGDHAGEGSSSERASDAELVKKKEKPKGKGTDGGSGSATTESSLEESVETHNFRRAGGWKRLDTEDKGAMEAGVGGNAKMGHRWGKTTQKDDRPTTDNAHMAYSLKDENQVYRARTNDLDPNIGERTKYYDKDEREAHRVKVKDGLLTGADGKLMDTQGADKHIRQGSAENRHLYAMNGEGGVFAADSIKENEASKAKVEAAKSGGPVPSHLEHIHHSTFLEGDAVNSTTGKWEGNKSQGVKGAGELDVKEGWLKNISNNSGHYTPDKKQLASTITELEKQGVNTDASKADYVSQDLTTGKFETETYMARAFAASEGNTKALDAQKTAMAGIKKGGFNLKQVHSPGEKTRAHNESRPGGAVTPGQKRAAEMANEAPGQGQGEGFSDNPNRFDMLEKGLPRWAKDDQKNKVSNPAPEISREPVVPKAQPQQPPVNQAPVVQPTVQADTGGGSSPYLMAGGLGGMGGGLPGYANASTFGGFGAPDSISSSSSEDEDFADANVKLRRGGWERKSVKGDKDGKTPARSWVPTDKADATINNKGHEKPMPPEDPVLRLGGSHGAGSYANEQKDHFGMRQPGLDPNVEVGTKHYNHKEREAHRLNAGNGIKDNEDLRQAHKQNPGRNTGLLTTPDGKPLDTGSAKAHNIQGAQAGRHIFALDTNKNMYSADATGETNKSLAKGVETGSKVDYVHHSSFTEGRAVDKDGKWQEGKSKGLLGAGEIEAKQGWLKNISNNSGHYEPGKESLVNSIDTLQDMGINTDATKVDYLKKNKKGEMTSRTYMANAFAKSEGDTKSLDAHSHAMQQIRSGGQSLLKPASERKPSGPGGALLGGVGLPAENRTSFDGESGEG